MIIGFVLIILWVFNFPSSPNLKRDQNQICGTLVRSTCTDYFTAKWNTRNIGKNLIMWLNRIEPLKTVSDAEKKYYYLSKVVYRDKGTKVIVYIGNKNCLNKKTYGPIWKLASPNLMSGNQFHDGFLYGTEAENGTLTGTLLTTFA